MQPDVSHLPQSAQLIVALIGLPATVVLVERHGGKEMKFYHREQRDDSLKPMVDVVGQEAAEKLFDYFGIEPFDVPRCTAALKTIRNTKILAEFDRLTGPDLRMYGRTAVHVLVEQFGLTERQIWRILKSPSVPRQAKQKSVDERQLSLI